MGVLPGVRWLVQSRRQLLPYFETVSSTLTLRQVTFGMVITGTLPAVRGALLFLPQMLGGIVAAALVRCMFPGPLLVQTTLQNGTSIAQGLFIEMFLTIELVITVLFMAAEKHKATFMAPVAIGLALLVAELAGTLLFRGVGAPMTPCSLTLTGVFFTGGSLNPARSFGPAVANAQFKGYHWIYWLGPMLGAAVAGGYYKFAKYNAYEGANPGQDQSHQSEEDDKDQ